MLARKQLTYEDAMAMRVLPHVVAVDASQQYRSPTGHLGSFSVKYGSHKVQNTMLEGDSEQQPMVYDLNLTQGRFFTNQEEQRRANVVVLGHDTAEELFGNEDRRRQRSPDRRGHLYRGGRARKQKQVFGGGKNPEDNSAHFPPSPSTSSTPRSSITGSA